MTLREAIAGATGLIGSNLAQHLVSKGWEVHGIARKRRPASPANRPIAGLNVSRSGAIFDRSFTPPQHECYVGAM